MEGSSIRSLAIVLLILIVSFFTQAPFADPWNKTDHLFRIERSINKNFVQFDVRLTENSNLPDSSPVIVYWVLESGQEEELTQIQQKYAYGIHSQEKIEQNRLRVTLAALKDREIIVEKINGSFRALVFINGIQSILERVYIESKPRLTGLPNVLYIDLFGRTKGINSTIRERIIPKGPGVRLKY